MTCSTRPGSRQPPARTSKTATLGGNWEAYERFRLDASEADTAQPAEKSGRKGSGSRNQRAAAPEIVLTCAACPGFVEFVEAGDVDSDQVHVLAERLLAPLITAEIDTLILGCTHYPLLARTIGDVMGRDVVLVSSADETAFAVRELLSREGSRAVPGPGGRRHLFLTSGPVDTFRELGARFLGPEVETIEAWQWS